MKSCTTSGVIKIKFADELGLLIWNSKNDFIALSELGKKYVCAKDDYFKDTLSEELLLF